MGRKMTVKSDQRKIIYEGNGTTTQFAVPFYFINQSDIEVSVYNGTTTTPLVLNTDYTLTGAGVETGGTVTTAEPVASGSEIAILRNVPYKQEMDIPENDIFPSQNMERALDRLTMQTQQLAEQVARSVTVDVFSDADPSELINEIEVLYDHKDEVITAAENIADISAVALIKDDVTDVASIKADVSAVALKVDDVSTAAAGINDIVLCAYYMNDIRAAPTKASEAAASALAAAQAQEQVEFIASFEELFGGTFGDDTDNEIFGGNL